MQLHRDCLVSRDLKHIKSNEATIIILCELCKLCKFIISCLSTSIRFRYYYSIYIFKSVCLFVCSR